MKKNFSNRVLKWFDQYGRKDLPWQKNITPYRVWVSEIMLQQTQVNTVIPYFERFMSRFPDIKALAKADQDEVLHLWTGLGYYSRARNLHHCAQIILHEFNAVFPDTLDELMKLPGIGRSTAGAILAISMSKPTSILDGNVKRVLCRYHGVEGWPGEKQNEKQLWDYADTHMPKKRAAEYTQAMMDLGAMICTRRLPKCTLCPLKTDCKAHHDNTMHLIPAPKPRKTLPVKNTLMLIITNTKNEILLQQRGQTGLWGGLWCFPECENEKEIPNIINEHFAILHFEKTPLIAFRHTFSHFHLDIVPYHIQLKEIPNVVMEDTNTIWYNIKAPQKIGMSAPVKRLLHQMETLNHDTQSIL